MAIPKVCGVETEYGILVRNADPNPVLASSVLINSYIAATSRKVGWDFEDERPGNDARGFNFDDGLAPEVESHLVNAVLTNGARYYVDHAHPEISTPECRDARECVIFDRAAEQIVRRSMSEARSLLPEGAELLVYKAAWKYDAGQPCGAEANAAKYFAAEAGYRACETAVLTHGGMGYAKEYHVERYLREAMLPRIAPVSMQMVFNFIAEKVLGLPKSY